MLKIKLTSQLILQVMKMQEVNQILIKVPKGGKDGSGGKDGPDGKDGPGGNNKPGGNDTPGGSKGDKPPPASSPKDVLDKLPKDALKNPEGFTYLLPNRLS